MKQDAEVLLMLRERAKGRTQHPPEGTTEEQVIADLVRLADYVNSEI